jgi:predicted GTPase
MILFRIGLEAADATIFNILDFKKNQTVTLVSNKASVKLNRGNRGYAGRL